MAVATFPSHSSHRFRTAFSAAGVAGLLIAYPFADSALGTGTVYAFTDAMIYVLLALGLNIVVGFAPLKPAEFVIFRIGQKTADARN